MVHVARQMRVTMEDNEKSPRKVQKNSKSKPSKEPSNKSYTRVKKGVVVDKKQPMAKSTTSRPKSKKDAKAITCASCSEEMNWDAKVDTRKESEVMRTTKNVMYYPLTAQTVKKWMRR